MNYVKKIFFPVLFLVLIASLGFKMVPETSNKEAIQTLPAFSYKTIDGITFSNRDLLENKPIIFIYFNSECHYCQNEARTIRNDQKNLKDIQLIFISQENQATVKEFAENYKLTGYDNIHLLFDERGDFNKTFAPTMTPFLVIYNKDRELVQKVEGAMPVAKILKTLQKG